MTTPTNQRAFADISLDGRDVTAQVLNYQLPSPQLASIDISGKRASFRRYGRLNTMAFTVTVSSAESRFLSGVGLEYDIEIDEQLTTPGQPSGSLVIQVTGSLDSASPGAYNAAADEVRDITLTYFVTKYKMTEGGNVVWDIDINANIFRQNGTPMFPAVSQSVGSGPPDPGAAFGG